jgi:hypothetical protein
MHYDIIGDIHGQADKLEALLARMGYRQQAGVWSMPGGRRKAVFVGDFVDRGPHQLRTVNIVRRMMVEGQALAVMGNHELNAIAWCTPDPDFPSDFLRRRYHPAVKGARNRQQHQRFLEEVQHDPALHAEIVRWFRTLPLWLDLGGLRVVHACWHGPSLQVLERLLAPDHSLPRHLLERALGDAQENPHLEGDEVLEAVETLLKGPEMDLPAGLSYLDPDGHRRTRCRVKWWVQDAQNLAQLLSVPKALVEPLRKHPVSETAQTWHTSDTRPVFFGHYWMPAGQEPRPLHPQAACVDYSAAKGGSLVAYRWQGEDALRADHFVQS